MAEEVEKITLPEAMQIVFACIAELKGRIETLEQLAEVNGYEQE